MPHPRRRRRRRRRLLQRRKPNLGKMKLTMQKLKDMKAKWATNKPKLKACRADVKSKGLAGDDRWFYIEECMSKT
ncbi:hypothetical protein ACVWXL_000956 [Bradyrhizobium sp. GM22.5]